MNTYDAELFANVHPRNWVNPKPAEKYNLVVLGAGTAGLVTAAGAAGLGAKVALIEKNLLGGDCLNYGCLPSKSVIRSARVYAEVLRAPEFGIKISGGTQADFGAVMERMRRIRAGVSRNDSVERFKGMGVDIFLGEGRFTGPGSLEVGGSVLKFAKAVIATGARPAEPRIPGGVKELNYLTNETIFNLTVLPRRLAFIGGGPINCELAQAFRRFGSEVTMIHSGAHVLNREDADAAGLLEDKLRREGVRLILNAALKEAAFARGERILHYESDRKSGSVAADEVFAGVGRTPNVDGLNLEAAGVRYDKSRGVFVDDYLQTDNPRIWACGDVCLDWKFTHAADAAARIVIQNALFFKSKKISSVIMPWCTYTDPEIAHVGLYEGDAKAKGIETETYHKDFNDVDRARTDGEEEGFVKILVKKCSDRILGATIVGAHAGELINEITLAMSAGIGLGKISGVVHPYPTCSEAIKQLGDAYNRKRLTPGLKKFFETWLSWQRR